MVKWRFCLCFEQKKNNNEHNILVSSKRFSQRGKKPMYRIVYQKNERKECMDEKNKREKSRRNWINQQNNQPNIGWRFFFVFCEKVIKPMHYICIMQVVLSYIFHNDIDYVIGAGCTFQCLCWGYLQMTNGKRVHATQTAAPSINGRHGLKTWALDEEEPHIKNNGEWH